MSEYVWQSGDDPDPRPRKRNDDLLDADRYMHELLQQLPRPFRTQTFRLFPEQPRRRARGYLEPH